MSRSGPAGIEGETPMGGIPAHTWGMVEGEAMASRGGRWERKREVMSVALRELSRMDWQAIREEGLRHVSAWMESDLLTIDETCLDMKLISPGDGGVQRSQAGFSPRGRKETDTI